MAQRVMGDHAVSIRQVPLREVLSQVRRRLRVIASIP
jgi:hypothetical protein